MTKRIQGGWRAPNLRLEELFHFNILSYFVSMTIFYFMLDFVSFYLLLNIVLFLLKYVYFNLF